MPSLIVSSRYTTDSQILRQTTQQLEWETLRLDGRQIPDWFDPNDDQIALFYTAPHAFDIAAQLSRTLLGCNPDWILALPHALVRRQIRQMSLRTAFELPGRSFIKHAVSKAFPAAVHDSRSLARAASRVLPDALVHVAEPVEWLVEYRCFVLDREVVTISPYQRYGHAIEGHAPMPGAPAAEISAAQEFAASVLQSPSVACPPAFVVDVGIIKDRGWAVVECNECWASGIYACEPKKVLLTLLRACVPTATMTADERCWDFQKHYFKACP
jgi:ATP-grasp domain, R2K clade family 2